MNKKRMYDMTKEKYEKGMKQFMVLEGRITEKELIDPIFYEINLWIVGKNLLRGNGSWEFVGVFDSEVKAVASCRTHQYFVGPVRLNEAFPDESCVWVGAYYPIKKDE